MLCDLCGRNEATFHLTEIVNGKMNEMHLCEECARKKDKVKEPFSLAELLSGLVDFEKETKLGEGPGLKCPNCGLTYADFRERGYFGCSRCYQTFKKILLPLLERIHGATRHKGAAPPLIGEKIRYRKEIQSLKEKLKAVIELEEFEKAARLRDQIRELEKKDN